MAGIFANVDSDINKLRQLKAEIENIKKALKSINVKVDIDIAKGMEAQLKSLMGQYDALVKKVSEAEGKIMLSTKRINDASEKIIKAQEQLSKSAGVNPQSGSGNANTAANNAETASVQAQAKAYDELAAEIDAVMGTRMQNIKRLIEEQNAIRLINEEIKKLTKYQSGSSLLSLSQQKRLEQLNNSLLTHKAALSEIRQTLMNNAKLDNAAATSMNGLSQSLSRMRIAYRELTEEERNSPFGKELLASINQADAKIKALDATIGNHQRNVGNYASGWNGLNMSVQQIVRELPAAAMGLNMFFLAISNNLPILTDEIKRAKARNAELIAQNQKATPVWKQLVSSLFSWQSAMMVGITLLTVYGKDIWNWVSSLFGANEAQKRLNESVKDFASVLGESQTQARLLFDAVKQTEEGTKGRAQAIEQINSSYGKYLPSLLTEKASLMEIKRAYEEVNRAMLENAAAKAKANAIDKVMDDTLSKQAEALEQITKVVSRTYGDKRASSVVQDIVKWTDRYIRMGNSQKNLFSMFAFQEKNNELPVGLLKYINNYISAAYDANEEIEKIQFKYDPFFNKEKADEAIVQNKEYWSKQREIYIKELESLSDEEAKGQKGWSLKLKISNIDKRIDSSYSLFNKEQSKNEGSRQQQQKLFDDLLQLRFQNQQDEINLMADGAEKRRKQIELDYRKEYAEIRKLEKEWTNQYGGKLTQEQTIEISRRYTNAEKKYTGEMFNIEAELIDDENDRIKAQEDSWNEYLIKYGNYQEKRKALIEKYNKEIAEAEAGDKAIKREEQKAALEALDEQYGESTRAMADLFEDASEKSVSSIQKIIDKYGLLIKYMSGTKQSDNTSVTVDELKDAGFTEKDIEKIERGEISIKDVTDAIKGLKEELKGKSPWQSFVSDMEKGINKLKTAAGDSQRVGEGITDIGNAVTEFSPALEEFGNSIANIFGVEDSNIAEITNTISGLGQTASGIGQIMSGDIIGGTMGAINGISAIVSAFRNIHDKKNEKQIRQLQEQIDALARSYEKLGKSADESYSTDAAKKIEQQNEMLEQQKVLIQQQIKEEQDKKKTDDGRIKEWQEQLDAINEQIGENEKKMQEAITGTSVMSAIDEFAQAYADAWAAGTDAAEASTKAVKSLIQTSLLEFLKKKLSPDVEKFMSNLANYMSDGIISPWEDEQLNRLKERMDATASNYFDQTGKYFEEDQAQEQQSASSRGFGTEMTHEDAGELSGRFTAVYESNLRIEMATQQQTMAITELKGPITAFTETSKGLYNIADETRTILANSYLELQQIRENTGEIIKPIKQMQLDIAEVKQNTSRL